MFQPQHHSRRSTRLAGHDYAGCGAYFVTVCASVRRPVFGFIAGGTVELNAHGRAVARLWCETSRVRAGVELDEWIVMPDHFHAIVWLPEQREDLGRRVPAAPYRPPRSLGSLMAGWKSRVTSQLWQQRAERGWPAVKIWQRNYHDHIIRDEHELDAIRRYIIENPMRPQDDDHFAL